MLDLVVLWRDPFGQTLERLQADVGIGWVQITKPVRRILAGFPNPSKKRALERAVAVAAFGHARRGYAHRGRWRPAHVPLVLRGCLLDLHFFSWR